MDTGPLTENVMEIGIRGRLEPTTGKFVVAEHSAEDCVVLRIDNEANLPFWLEVYIPLDKVKEWSKQCVQA
jgi:hypothetical protein